jgi:hypothetical protein
MKGFTYQQAVREFKLKTKNDKLKIEFAPFGQEKEGKGKRNQNLQSIDKV